jgi:(R)-2-hydroxyacyl-CoA dehydratese activating ATPase
MIGRCKEGKPVFPTEPALGIDLGSRNVKLCLVENGKMTAARIIETVAFYREYGTASERGFAVDFSALGFKGVARITATGYGRMSAALAGAGHCSELTAHVRGARFQTGLNDFMLIDMGGQDYKIIRVADGRMTDMATNDKCAASTGRYIENMARTLGMTLEEIGACGEDPVELTSTCAIFGESEIIGLMVRGVPVTRLAAGVNRSVVERVLPLLDRMNSDIIVMSGGVALNYAVVSLLGRITGRYVKVVENPLMNGAIGCCIDIGNYQTRQE